MQNPLIKLVTAVTLAMLPILATPANATSSWLRAVDTQYPWCALYSGINSSTNCGFTTRQQCLATVSGIGGSCEPNQFYHPPQTPVRKHKRAAQH